MTVVRNLAAAIIVAALALVCCGPVAAGPVLHGLPGFQALGPPPVTPPPGSVQSAVLLTQEAGVNYPAGSIANSPYLIMAVWFNATKGDPGIDPTQSYAVNVLAGNIRDLTCGGTDSAETTPGVNLVNESPGAGGLWRFNVNNATCGSGNSALGSLSPTLQLNGSPHLAIFYEDVSQDCGTGGAHARCGGVIIDGTQVLSGFADQGGNWTGTKTIAYAVNKFMLNPWATPEDSANGYAAGKFAMGPFYLNTHISPVVPGTNTFAFPVSAFISGGKPVDYGASCTGPTGAAPTICHKGDKTAYLTNQGDLGVSPTITGRVVSAVNNVLYNAPIGPGEVPDRPYIKASYPTQFNGICAESLGTCTLSHLNAGYPIDNGDKVCFVVTITGNNGTFDEAFALSGGFTEDPLGGTKANGNFNNIAMKCKTWTGGAVTAGTDMGSLTLTWTGSAAGGYGGGGGGAALNFLNFGKYGAGGTTPTIAVAAVTDNTASSTTIPFPTVTAPAGNSLWVGISTVYDWGFASPQSGIGPPTTSELYQKVPVGGGSNNPLIAWEKISSAGAVVRTGQGNAGNRPLDIALILNSLWLVPACRRRPANENRARRLAA